MNGWKNWATWNVALWIDNEEYLYREAEAFMRRHRKRPAPYRHFIERAGLAGTCTPDGARYDGSHLSYTELNRMMREFLND